MYIPIDRLFLNDESVKHLENYVSKKKKRENVLNK